MGAPLLVVGLDGATLDLIEPGMAAGRLPVLAALMARGAWGRLRSTIPAATFPAWTSLVTGVNPGRHGLLDFTRRDPDGYGIRFVNGSYRRMPALWTRIGAEGGRVAVVTVPATFPPEEVAGVMVSGFDSPLATEVDGRFVFPRAFHADIRRLVGRLPFADFQEVHTGPGWHEDALARLLDGVEKRATVVEHLLRREPWDLTMVVFGESDTVAHHFWRFADPASPRFAPSPWGDGIDRVYDALDRAVGRLLAAAGPDAVIAVVSDHGSGGASDLAIHLNRRLAECGLLAFRPGGSGRIGSALRDAALRMVPHRVQGRMLRQLPTAAGRLEGQHRFGAIAWEQTAAYSEELDYHPSVWLNLEGREPDGQVAPADYEAVRTQVEAALTSWRHADGRPVVDRVWRREELYSGPHVDEAPDLLLEVALVDGYSPSCLRAQGEGPSIRRLAAAEHGAGKGAGMNGSHRRDGLFVLAGPGVPARGRCADAEIVDVLPTLMALAGRSVPAGLDGQVIAAAVDTAVAMVPDALSVAGSAPQPYTAESEAAVAARLAALGYLEPSP